MMDFVEMATVVRQDPANFAVFVLIDRLGAQGPTLPVQVLTPGPRDGTTIKAKDGLPTIGTRGLVAFPRRDARNGHWMGATAAGLISANSLVPGQEKCASYAAHYAGGYSAMADDGTVVEGLPDGSVIQLGPTAVTPSEAHADGEPGATGHALPGGSESGPGARPGHSLDSDAGERRTGLRHIGGGTDDHGQGAAVPDGFQVGGKYFVHAVRIAAIRPRSRPGRRRSC